ncbi:precorrin-6y C5,15-methyltransferase (decarboxylating) subunit CbiE [Paroceanicella profunda]|uniref:Precorrin-6y C5,15-methyltransferase (Decarboxylating) subunit CbiE n=1 Tax=Paroceanicella profunda TaxID=2579971 RepID=A0A5B8G1G2_9RHOB|nr:precorrin-6y C5,15-methyltransferase (decarboxylating) subunit CbiE [Paroceanicella profunda]QDL93039.1 precorrin-6y C5,15-methyltransferase (decarboxylating) subunit CbiE [Paroceanicella profunda]
MTSPWLQIVGMGEDGPAGLGARARAAFEAAEVLVGGARHHALAAGHPAERMHWPSPFCALVAEIAAHRGRRVTVMATGDPMWFSVGETLAAAFGAEAELHPHPSAFQLAAARMGWPLAGVETLTVHGRPVETLLPHVTPGARLLVLSDGPGTPAAVAALLGARGFGDSRLTVLAAMGGAREARAQARAADWQGAAPAFHTLAVECVAGPQAQLLSRVPGLPEAVYLNDGTITKAEVRAVTLARLMPMPGALLWDLGCGAGSVSIEWMRAARDARAIGVEARADRLAFAGENARRLGVPGLRLVAGTLPEALADLPAPDAVFIGGGLGEAVVDRALAALRPLGRLVANCVTLEGASLATRLQARHGGDLTEISVSRAGPLGPHRAWAPLRPVTQWSLQR